MNWRSSNLWYAVILGPLVVAAAALAYWLLAPSGWAYLPPILVLLLTVWGGRKLACLPGPVAGYGDMTEMELALPLDYGVRVMACPEMDRHAFIPRTVEFLSPWRFGRGARPILAVNPGAVEKHGELFVAMASVREIERYRRHVRLKTVVHLLAPILLMGCGAAAIFLFGQEFLGPALSHFAAPFAFSILVIGHLVMWNRAVSRRENELDDALAGLYSPEAVREFIAISERVERQGMQGEKSRALNEYYMRERLKRFL